MCFTFLIINFPKVCPCSLNAAIFLLCSTCQYTHISFISAYPDEENIYPNKIFSHKHCGWNCRSSDSITTSPHRFWARKFMDLQSLYQNFLCSEDIYLFWLSGCLLKRIIYSLMIGNILWLFRYNEREIGAIRIRGFATLSITVPSTAATCLSREHQLPSMSVIGRNNTMIILFLKWTERATDGRNWMVWWS